MEMIKSLIIDDDPFIRDLLEDKLTQNIPNVTVIATASSGEEGLALIDLHQPDLIFLDIEMSDMTGFEMLNMTDVISFQTIFITSYSHHAIKAIRFNALDYLVKPIDLDELKKAIIRYEDQSNRIKQHINLQLALENSRTDDVAEHKLILETKNDEIRLAIKYITHIEGERNYSKIHLANKKTRLISKTLSELVEILEGKGFYRCHKSHVVNGQHINEIRNNVTLVLSNEVEVPISRRKKDDFNSWFGQFLNAE